MTTSLYDPPSRVSAHAHVQSMQQYRQMHAQSVENPPEFWGRIAEEFYWKEKPTREKFLEYNLDYTKGK